VLEKIFFLFITLFTRGIIFHLICQLIFFINIAFFYIKKYHFARYQDHFIEQYFFHFVSPFCSSWWR
jgi:hypothetical protein